MTPPAAVGIGGGFYHVDVSDCVLAKEDFSPVRGSIHYILIWHSVSKHTIYMLNATGNEYTSHYVSNFRFSFQAAILTVV